MRSALPVVPRSAGDQALRLLGSESRDDLLRFLEVGQADALRDEAFLVKPVQPGVPAADSVIDGDRVFPGGHHLRYCCFEDGLEIRLSLAPGELLGYRSEREFVPVQRGRSDALDVAPFLNETRL